MEAQKAALSSVIWSALLVITKLAAGLASNSLGLLSEALHSALDFVAAGITFFAVRMASTPADEKHPFGHGKVEHLSALAETALLLLTCAWIIYEAVDRLFFSAATVEPSWWLFAVIIFSLVVDINRSAMLRKAAKEHRSQALEADALHFTTDIWSSAVVLVGLICVSVSTYLPEPWSGWLHKGDALAALGVALIVLRVSWDLARRAIFALMDGGLLPETDQLRRALARKAPAWIIRSLRVRESGAHYFVDMTAQAPATLRMGEAHGIAHLLEAITREELPGAEVTVHLEPGAEKTGPHDAARDLALHHGLSVHGLALMDLEDGLHIFFHVVLPPQMPLGLAHARVSAYEDDLKQRLGAVHVISHLEPERDPNTVRPEQGQERELILATLEACLGAQPLLSPCHDAEVWQVAERTSLACRCACRHPMDVRQAHELATRVEEELQGRLPHLSRVFIHIEPAAGSDAKTVH